jgi:hypothetical protein
MTSSTSPTISGSRAEVGSSKSMTSWAAWHSARTMAMRCFCPPESAEGIGVRPIGQTHPLQQGGAPAERLDPAAVIIFFHVPDGD